MNRSDLIAEFKAKAGISYVEARKVVNVLFDTIADSMVTEDRVEIRGLCSFFIKNIKPIQPEIPKQEKKYLFNPKNFHFSSVGKNLRNVLTIAIKER